MVYVSLRYACFISYRHGQQPLARRIINDLYDALVNELDLLVDAEADDGPIAIDRKRLEGGKFYNEELAVSLCESACMVMVFTPVYFSKQHTYCTREYKGMEALEKERLRLLKSGVDKRNGLIIPVVFRGAQALPKEIEKLRQYYLFDEYTLADPEISKNPRYVADIKKMAQYIADRFEAVSKLPVDACTQCENFALPTEDEIRPWLEDNAQDQTVFVLRGGGSNWS